MRLALLPLLLTSCLTSGEEYDALVLRALDGDGDGFFAEAHDGSDCDDEDPAVHPDALEVCDLKDNDCDGELDEGFTLMWYLDADGDGYGDPGSPFQGCSPPTRYVSQGEDCDDTDATVNPSTVWYYDSDGDGFGIDSPRRYACEAPEGFAPMDGDCDDFDDAVHPGAEEPCDEAVDYNCDGAVGFSDGDGDGVPACEDCDDSRAEVAPDAPETCDGLDNDCDRDVDEAVLKTFYRDLDGDSYGDALTSQEACEAPAGWVADDDDCDDTDALVSPAQEEFFEDKSDAGSWDYNCDGRSEKKYGAKGDACSVNPKTGDCEGEGYYSPIPSCGRTGNLQTCTDECYLGMSISDFIQPCR